MNKCSHPESLLGWCYRSAPCLDVCEWAARNVRLETTNQTSPYKNLNDWEYAKDCQETLVSPCGRYEITRVRVTILGRRYSAWDKYPTDGDGLPALAGVADSAPGALRCINER